MSDMGSHNFSEARPGPVSGTEQLRDPEHGTPSRRSEGYKIGEVIEIAGSGSTRPSKWRAK